MTNLMTMMMMMLMCNYQVEERSCMRTAVSARAWTSPSRGNQLNRYLASFQSSAMPVGKGMDITIQGEPSKGNQLNRYIASFQSSAMPVQ